MVYLKPGGLDRGSRMGNSDEQRMQEHAQRGRKRDSERWQTRVLALELLGSEFRQVCSFCSNTQLTPTQPILCRRILQLGRCSLQISAVAAQQPAPATVNSSTTDDVPPSELLLTNIHGGGRSARLLGRSIGRPGRQVSLGGGGGGGTKTAGWVPIGGAPAGAGGGGVRLKPARHLRPPPHGGSCFGCWSRVVFSSLAPTPATAAALTSVIKRFTCFINRIFLSASYIFFMIIQ